MYAIRSYYDISSMIETSKIVDGKDKLSLQDKYLLSQAPITAKSKIILQARITSYNVCYTKLLRY